ncbi:MAG: AbrB/MazE/SpoVT family DNA-binding domain-containing protein [Promethearchaeota archaeon]
MIVKKIVNLDQRGRIVIPKEARNALGITTNSQLMMISDSEAKEIRITPIGLSGDKNPIKLRIIMADIPGALARLATLFGNLELSMMYSEAVIIEKDKTAIWTVISESPNNLEDLKEALMNQGGAIKVEVLPLE